MEDNNKQRLLDERYIRMARIWGENSYCKRRQVGALIVKEKMRVPISTAISAMRVEFAAGLLRDPELTIQQVAEQMSFSDQSSFGKFFKKHTGVSPLKYRQNLKKTLLTLRQSTQPLLPRFPENA